MSSITEIKNFVKFAASYLGLNSVPQVKFVGSAEDKKATFGHFDGKSITVRATNRHPIDVMRTVAHELIHHKQRLQGSHSREGAKEDEANAIAGRIMKAYDTKFPQMFRSKPIYETESAVPVNAMGGSSSTAGTGPIDTYDPLLKTGNDNRKKLRTILKRTPPKAIGENTIFHKTKLNLGMNVGERDGERAKQPMKKKFGLLDNYKTKFGIMVKREQDPMKREGGRTAAPFNGKKISVGI